MEYEKIFKSFMSVKARIIFVGIFVLCLLSGGYYYLPDLIWDMTATAESCFKVEITSPLEMRKKCRNDDFYEERAYEYTEDGLEDEVEEEQYSAIEKMKKIMCMQKSSVVAIKDYNSKCGENVKIPQKIEGKKVWLVDNQAFKSKKIRTLKLPNTLLGIGDQAFMENELQEVDIPASVVFVKDSAFKNNMLERLNLRYGLMGIGESVFMQNNLKNISVPSTVIEIDDYAFSENELENIELSKKLKQINKGVFYNNNIKNIDIPKSVDYIEEDAFRKNDIEKVVLNESIADVSQNAFDKNVDIRLE